MTLKLPLTLISILFIILTVTVSTACSRPHTEKPNVPEQDDEVSIQTLAFSTPAFEDGGEIPNQYSCYGIDYSPELNWSKGPEGTKTFVLIVDDPIDPDTIFAHWVLYDIPPDVTSLPEGITTNGQLENMAVQGRNSYGRLGWKGPCPQTNEAREYRFTIYALDTHLNLPGAYGDEVLNAMEGHILAKGQFTGIYQQ